MFTLALTCLQDGRDEDYAFDLLDQFNSNLEMPLSTKEVEACVASAYSGRYNGPKKEYVEQFIELYAVGDADLFAQLFLCTPKKRLGKNINKRA